MSVFKRMIEKWKDENERVNLMVRNNVIYYDTDNGLYFVCINYRNLPAGNTPDFYIEFENEQQAKKFMQDHCYTYYGSGVKRNGNKIDLMYCGNTNNSHIVKCGDNEELAKRLVKLFRKQYAEYRESKRNKDIFAEQEEKINDMGVKF